MVPKAYRSYGGDFKRLTDIVRCSLILDTPDGMIQLLKVQCLVWTRAHFALRHKTCTNLKLVFAETIRERVHTWARSSWVVSLGQVALESVPCERSRDDSYHWRWSWWFVSEKRRIWVTSCATPPSAFCPFVHPLSTPVFQVRNRFAEENPQGGYRDINVKIRLGFKADPKDSRPIFCPVYVKNARSLNCVRT